MPKVKDIFDAKAGLAVVNPELKDENNSGIVHVVFYTKKPTKKDIKELQKELGEDEEFGLTKIADSLEIYQLTKKDVEKYIEFMDEQGVEHE